MSQRQRPASTKASVSFLATGLAVLVIAWAASPGYAGLSSEQIGCRRAVGAAGAKYFKSVSGTLARCRNAVGSGKLPAATDCASEAGTVAKLSKAVGKLDKKLAKKCTDAVTAALRFGDDCESVSTTTGLTTCVQSSHDRAAAGLLATTYATGGELVKAARKCQATASKEARKLAVDRVKRLRKCKDAADLDKLPVGTLCTEDPDTAALLARPRPKAQAKIVDKCDAAALADLDFGAPCELPADGATLASCLLAQSDRAGGAASRAAYGDGSFCGDTHQAVEARVDELIGQLTLEEKTAQMHGLGAPIDNAWRTTAVPALAIPGFGMLDGPRGPSVVAGNGTAFPVAIARGASWDIDLEQRVGAAIGREVRAKGASVVLAPVTAVIRHPRWGRSQESYGEDPLHIGAMGVAFVRGAQQYVISSVKHYAVNSIEDTRFTVDITVDERTLREIYLPHFRRVVEDGDAASVMSAYNLVNDRYCGENPHLLSDILKGEWGFRGFVESDWIFGTHDTINSALAGLDIEMPIPIIYGQPLADAVIANDVPESAVNESVRRILRTQLCFGLDSDPPVVDPTQVESAEHIALALEAARKGIVLLENDADTLPLERGSLTEIVVTGPLADVENIGDNGSSNVAPTDVVTILEGIVDGAGSVTVTHVPDPSTGPGQAAVAGADAVVIVTGLTFADEGEGQIGAGDRETYSLPPDREQLIIDVAALNSRTIVVLEGGSAIGVEAWVDDIEALIMAWYPGLQGGNAVADVLFGDVNPSGRMPLVVAALESDLPPFINDQDEVTYDYYHGYRLLDRDTIAPRYPFGHGLSYTTYSYSNLAIAETTLAPEDTLRISFDVTNAGGVDGDEVAQLYVSYLGSAVDRPVRDLEGFVRVSLGAGETETVSIEVPIEDLAYYDVGLPGWVVESIGYGVHVGSSSADLPLSGSFSVSP